MFCVIALQKPVKRFFFDIWHDSEIKPVISCSRLLTNITVFEIKGA